MKKLLTIFLCGISLAAFAQPANDVCADNITLPTDGTCLTGETTAGAADNWVGAVGCQSGGGGNEVWYRFTADSTEVDISVTAGTATGDVNIILVEDVSGPCGSLFVRGSYCGAASGSLTETTTAGSDYIVTINFEGSDGTFDVCATASNPPPVPGVDCTSAEALCNSNSFSQGNVGGIGTAEELSTPSCYGRDEQQSKWYTFTADESGTFEMMITPNTFADDFDFLIIDATSGCYSTGVTIHTPIVCDWSGCMGTTGIANDPSASFGSTGGLSDGQWQNNNPAGPGDCFAVTGPPPAQQWEATISLTAGNTYTMLIDNYSTSGGGFDVEFGGTTTMGPDAEFSASVAANCYDATFDRLTHYTGANMTYSWNFGDGSSSTSAVPSHTYSTDGLYTVTLTVTDANGCTNTYSQTVNAGCITLALNPVDLEVKRKSKTQNLITWKTNDTEKGHFEIERADTKKKNFVKIGEVEVSESLNNYSFVDENIFEGKSFYRIKSVNEIGRTNYSKIVSSNYEDALPFKVYPNPVEGNELFILPTAEKESIHVEIYSLSGQRLINKDVNPEVDKSVNTSNLSKGVYFLKISDVNGHILYTEKVIKN